MIGFLWKNKAKAVIRTKIITVFLDNYIRLRDGREVDDWGNDWKEKSFNEVIAFFRDNEKDFKIKSKYQFIPMRLGSLVRDIDDLTIYDAYKVLFDIYFGGKPSNKELNKLEYEFKNEVTTRGLHIDMKMT